MRGWTIGIIGGSGLYALDGLDDTRWHDVETPWGAPSDRILEGADRRRRGCCSCRATAPATAFRRPRSTRAPISMR